LGGLLEVGQWSFSVVLLIGGLMAYLWFKKFDSIQKKVAKWLLKFLFT